MNFKQLLVGTMLLSSIMTPIASQAEAGMFQDTEHMQSAIILGTAATMGLIGVHIGAGAAMSVSTLYFIASRSHLRYDKDVEDDLLGLAMGEEVDSALLAEFLNEVRNNSEEVEEKTGVNIDDLSDQELAAFLVSPLEQNNQ